MAEAGWAAGGDDDAVEVTTVKNVLVEIVREKVAKFDTGSPLEQIVAAHDGREV